MDHQHWFVDVLPDHAAAQARGAVHDLLPGLAQRARVRHPVQEHPGLVKVRGRVGVEHGMEQHAGLQRGQRPDVFHRAAVAGQPVHGCLVQGDQREIRRRPAARPRAAAMLHDLIQRLHHLPGQLAYRGLVVHLGGVEPAQLQFAACHQAGDR